MRLILAIALILAAMGLACTTDEPDVAAATPDAAVAPTAADNIAHIEFPSWVDKSPAMAQAIAYATTIVRARVASISSATTNYPDYGPRAELTYKFEVDEYLKGDGDDELAVLRVSILTRDPSSDTYLFRTESEAQELADLWLVEAQQTTQFGQDSIILLGPSGLEGSHAFIQAPSDQSEAAGGVPTYGETWLISQGDSLYQHRLTDGESETISLSELSDRINDLEGLSAGGLDNCVDFAVGLRTWVRNLVDGRDSNYPDGVNFRKFLVTVGSTGATPPYYPELTVVRPPYETPRFSHYWLDGPDKGLFSLEAGGNLTTVERLHMRQNLAAGEYRVNVNQGHMSLPCAVPFYYDPDAESWQVSETTEWVITVTDTP